MHLHLRRLRIDDQFVHVDVVQIGVVDKVHRLLIPPLGDEEIVSES